MAESNILYNCVVWGTSGSDLCREIPDDTCWIDIFQAETGIVAPPRGIRNPPRSTGALRRVLTYATIHPSYPWGSRYGKGCTSEGQENPRRPWRGQGWNRAAEAGGGMQHQGVTIMAHSFVGQ